MDVITTVGAEIIVVLAVVQGQQMVSQAPLRHGLEKLTVEDHVGVLPADVFIVLMDV